MKPQPSDPKPKVERISISLPAGMGNELDRLVESRKFESRSQAVAWMIQESTSEMRRETGDAVMVGSITLFFKQTRPGIMQELASLKRRCVDEVIGSLQVQLEDDHLMEVIVVQGPADVLQVFTDELVACKGVRAGKLSLTTTIIPPIHPLPGRVKPETC